MNYLANYTAQRIHLSRLCRVLGIPLSEQSGARKVPRHNDALRVAIHDACLGLDWSDVAKGRDALAIDRELALMVSTLEMGHGFNLAAAQACIRAGKHEARMGRQGTAYVRDKFGRLKLRPMTHQHRMRRFKAAEAYYAEARRYQQLHEEERRGA